MISTNRILHVATIRFVIMIGVVLVIFGSTTTIISNNNSFAQKSNSSIGATDSIHNNSNNATTASANNNVEPSRMFGMQPALPIPRPPPLAVSNITSSVPFFSLISNAMTSKVHTSLTNATITAEKTAGSNSHAILARLAFENGYLMYNIWVIDPNDKIQRVTIDAGNGKIISNQQISLLERRQLETDMMIGSSPGSLPPLGMSMIQPPLFPLPSGGNSQMAVPHLVFPPPPPASLPPPPPIGNAAPRGGIVGSPMSPSFFGPPS